MLDRVKRLIWRGVKPLNEKKNAKKCKRELQGFRVVLISPSRSEKRGLRKKEIRGLSRSFPMASETIFQKTVSEQVGMKVLMNR